MPIVLVWWFASAHFHVLWPSHIYLCCNQIKVPAFSIPSHVVSCLCPWVDFLYFQNDFLVFFTFVKVWLSSFKIQFKYFLKNKEAFSEGLSLVKMLLPLIPIHNDWESWWLTHCVQYWPTMCLIFHCTMDSQKDASYFCFLITSWLKPSLILAQS